MNTLEFFQTILPEGGITYLALFKPGLPYPIHRPYDSLEAMAEAVASYNIDPNFTGVYHACGNYKFPEVLVEVGERTKKRFRVPENWNRAKSFWMDIDCGEAKAESGKGYATKLDATKAVAKFAKQIGWPMPLLVDSGNGVHVYWPLNRSIRSEVWVKMASLLKAASTHFGLIADPSRTADLSSVLRPVGAMNRKDISNPKKISAKNTPTFSSPEDLYRSLKSITTALKIEAATEAPSKRNDGLNSDLTAHLDFGSAPALGATIAEHCQQFQRMAETKGDVNYEVWRGVIGVLTHCDDGEELAEEWTSNRSSTGHDNIDWRTRYTTWSSPPTSCEFFVGHNAPGCEGCPHKGKIKTPIVLGRYIPPPAQDQTEEIVTEDEKVEVVSIPTLPDGYQWQPPSMVRLLADKDGFIQPHAFAGNLFYPTSRIRGDDGIYRIGLRMHLHNKKVRDFQMPFEAMAAAGDILKSVAKYEILQTNNKDATMHLTAYLRDSLEKLKKQVDETNTMTTFGWKDDTRAFLIGDRYYSADGTVRQVLLGGYAAAKSSALPAPVGTLKGYSDALNHVYNRPGMVSLQYFIVSGWGSLLNVFCEELYSGLMCAATGGDSGKGKSTAAYAGLYAFGDATSMALKSGDAATKNAIWATAGTFNNVPMLFDELTDMPAEEFSTLAYTLSLGEERARLQAGGAGIKFAAQARFKLSPYGTANCDLHGKLAATQANSQAEAVRLVQVRVDLYPIPKLEETEVHRALERMQENRGNAGDVITKYVVANAEKVRARVQQKVADLVQHIPGTKFRFYRSHAACTIVMAEIARSLGVIQFDVAEMQRFAIELMQLMAASVDANNTVTVDDAFSRMVASMTPGIIITSEFRDVRGGGLGEPPKNRIVGEIVGRWVTGSLKERSMAGRLFLCQKSMRNWCTKNRTDFGNVMEYLRSAGALVSEDEKITLTRGTDLPRVQQRCVIIDTQKLEAGAPVLVVDNTLHDDRDAV